MSRISRSALLEGTDSRGGGVRTSGSGEGGAGHRPGRVAARSRRPSVCKCSSRDPLRRCAIEGIGFAGATRKAGPAGLGVNAASGLLELSVSPPVDSDMRLAKSSSVDIDRPCEGGTPP